MPTSATSRSRAGLEERLHKVARMGKKRFAMPGRIRARGLLVPDLCGRQPPELLDDHPTDDQQPCGTEEEMLGSHDLGARSGDRRAHDAAENPAGADEAEEPLGFPRAVERSEERRVG